MKKIYLLLFVLCFLVSVNLNSQSLSGSGTEASPFLITNASDLEQIMQYPDVYMAADIFLKQTTDITLINNWVPIGTSATQFRGTFDGNNKTISGLKVNSPDVNYQGFFGFTSNTATIKNVGLIAPSVTGNEFVGALIGRSGANVKNCYADNSIVSGKVNVGGLIGQTSSAAKSVEECYVTGNITGQSYTGGLIGQNTSKVITSYSDVTVLGTSERVGGLIGDIAANFNTTIESCYSKGSVTVNSDNEVEGVGGLVGKFYTTATTATVGTINKCYSSASVTANNAKYVGGLIGQNYKGVNILKSFTLGDVSGGSYVGGISGQNFSKGVSDSFTSGNITALADGAGGISGVINNAEGVVKNCIAFGAIQANNNVGGIVGESSGTTFITNCVAANTSLTSVSAEINRLVGKRASGLENVIGYALTSMLVNGVTVSVNNEKNGTSKSEPELQTENTYKTIAWDFSNDWIMNTSGNKYPILKWAYDANIPTGVEEDGVVNEVNNVWVDQLGTLNLVSESEMSAVRVFDISGKTILVYNNLNAKEFSATTNNWNKGIYIVNISTLKGSYSFKVSTK